jgi:hypothetical protein
METGSTARLLGVRVQRLSARTWLIAGEQEMHLLTTSDHVLKRAGYAPLVELETVS